MTDRFSKLLWSPPLILQCSTTSPNFFPAHSFASPPDQAKINTLLQSSDLVAIYHYLKSLPLSYSTQRKPQTLISLWLFDCALEYQIPGSVYDEVTKFSIEFTETFSSPILQTIAYQLSDPLAYLMLDGLTYQEASTALQLINKAT